MNETKDTARYTVFTRTWWEHNPSWPDGREPCVGNRHTLARDLSRREAYAMCQEWNATHKPGKLSNRAEFEQQ